MSFLFALSPILQHISHAVYAMMESYRYRGWELEDHTIVCQKRYFGSARDRMDAFTRRPIRLRTVFDPQRCGCGSRQSEVKAYAVQAGYRDWADEGLCGLADGHERSANGVGLRGVLSHAGKRALSNDHLLKKPPDSLWNGWFAFMVIILILN